MSLSALNEGRLKQWLWLIVLFGVAGCSENRQDDRADVHVLAAETYFDQGQFRPAMIEVQNALQLEPTNEPASVLGAKIRLELGGTRAAYKMLESFVSGSSFDYYATLTEAYIQSRKYNSALALLLQNAGKFPDQKVDLLVFQARAFAGIGNRQRARELYNEALALNPGNLNARLGKLALTASAGDFVSAEEGLSEVLETSPDSLDALLLLGAVQMRAGDVAAAEVTLSNAVSVLPATDIFTRQRAGVLRALIDLLSSQGRSGEALVYQRALDEAFPQSQENADRIQEVLAKIDNNELQQAELLLNELYAENPDFSTGGAMLGLLNYVQGRNEAAEAFFTQAVDPEIASEPILKAVAVNYYRLNNPKQVVATLRERIEASEDVFLIAIYAMAALKIGEEEIGENFMRRAISMAPENAALRVRLGQHYSDQLPPRHDEALQLLEEGIELNPESWSVRVAHLYQLLAMDRMAEARQALNELPDPDDEVLVWLTRGAFFIEIEAFVEAIAEYQRVLETAPTNKLAALGLAFTDFQLNRFDAGIDRLKKILAEDASSEEALTLAIRAYYDLDRLPEGVEFVSGYNEANDFLSAVVLSEFLTRIGAISDATQYVDVLAERNRNAESLRLNAKVNYARALDFAQRGDLEQARTAIFSALRSYPLNPTLLKTLARIEIDAKQYAEAEKIIDDISTRQAGSPLVLELFGDLSYAQNLFVAAMDNYQQAWNERMTDSLGIKISALYQSMDNSQGLETFVAEWRARDPASQFAVINEVALETALALELYTDFLNEYPDSPLIRNNLALVLAEAGSLEQAVSMAEQAASQAPNNPSILDTYGWLLFQKGRFEGAIEQLSRAAALAPSNSVIANHLKQAREAR